MDPTYKKGIGRLVTDRYNFQSHIDGTDFRQNANTIDLSPPVTVGVSPKTTVQGAIESLAAITTSPVISDATTTSKGIVKLDGDLGSGSTGTADSPKVTGLYGKSISSSVGSSLENGTILFWNGSVWNPTAMTLSAADVFTWSGTSWTNSTIGGDISGTISALSVDKISGIGLDFSTPPAFGDVLNYDGLNWAPISLSSLSLNLVGDVVGTTGSNVVEQITGNAGNVNFIANNLYLNSSLNSSITKQAIISGSGTDISILGQETTDTAGKGGNIILSSGSGVNQLNGGDIQLTSGQGTGSGGTISITSGNGGSVSGGNINISAGEASSGDGGSINIIPGATNSGTNNGLIKLFYTDPTISPPSQELITVGSLNGTSLVILGEPITAAEIDPANPGQNLIYIGNGTKPATIPTSYGTVLPGAFLYGQNGKIFIYEGNVGTSPEPLNFQIRPPYIERNYQNYGVFSDPGPGPTNISAPVTVTVPGLVFTSEFQTDDEVRLFISGYIYVDINSRGKLEILIDGNPVTKGSYETILAPLGDTYYFSYHAIHKFASPQLGATFEVRASEIGGAPGAYINVEISTFEAIAIRP